LKKLYARWGDRVHFVDVLVRQAHPGPSVPAYRDFPQKLRDAQAYQEDEGIPWTVLVDDLEGTVHQTYGGMADPTYLIGTDGKVAFYNMWTYAPALHEALRRLLEQGGRGQEQSDAGGGGGVDHVPHLGPAAVAGWKAIQRGLPTSYLDLETAAPGAASATWLTSRLRPVLGPLALRAKPLPPSARRGLAMGAAALALLGAWRVARRDS
jgi:hypothetical protein